MSLFSNTAKHLFIACSISIFLTGCGSNDEKDQEATAESVGQEQMEFSLNHKKPSNPALHRLYNAFYGGDWEVFEADKKHLYKISNGDGDGESSITWSSQFPLDEDRRFVISIYSLYYWYTGNDIKLTEMASFNEDKRAATLWGCRILERNEKFEEAGQCWLSIGENERYMRTQRIIAIDPVRY